MNTEHAQSSAPLDRLVGPWFVHVFVRGHYAGAYRFRRRFEAVRDKKDRESLAAVGCSYVISRDEFICQTCDRGVERGDVFCESCRGMM